MITTIKIHEKVGRANEKAIDKNVVKKMRMERMGLENQYECAVRAWVKWMIAQNGTTV